jgi:hypothetical protein
MNEVPKELMEKARAAIYEEDERARSFMVRCLAI